jgi:hypothetical protein
MTLKGADELHKEKLKYLTAARVNWHAGHSGTRDKKRRWGAGGVWPRGERDAVVSSQGEVPSV